MRSGPAGSSRPAAAPSSSTLLACDGAALQLAIIHTLTLFINIHMTLLIVNQSYIYVDLFYIDIEIYI